MKKKKIILGITDFALPTPKKGSIDLFSGFGNSLSMGAEIHKLVQAEKVEKYSNYEAEVSISHEFSYDDYTFIINGRMDGVYRNEKLKIEEIKSGFNIFELYRYLKNTQDDHPYCLQLKTYGYFHWLRTKEIPDLSFHLVSTRNSESIDYSIYLDIDDYQKWLECRLNELVEEVNLAQKIIKRRKKAAKLFRFPFEQPRIGQVELINTVEDAAKEDKTLLLQAPTGLGKTIAVLYPMLQEALHRGQKVIYLTPKNSQHAVAEDAISRLQGIGAQIKSLTLTAKNKLCFKNEPICKSEYCEFAKEHYTKVAQNKLPTVLAKKKKLTARTFKKVAKEYQVCPFELQFEVIKKVDMVICDYNYVFAPRLVSSRVASNNISEIGKPNLIIDEVHNLPARGMDYYSPSLSVMAFEKMLQEIATIPEHFQKKVKKLLAECILIIKNTGPKGCKTACKINPPVSAFTKQDVKLREFLSTYLNSDVIIESHDVVMRCTYYWSEFTAALEFINLGKKEFFTIFNPDPDEIKITCCDASEMLKPYYKEFKQIVGFSATLKPFDFYSQLTGLKSEKLKTAEFSSPFPKEKRKILIIPQVSSKYSERKRNYPRIAEVIQKITSLQAGNYFAFFPSFDFLEKTLNVFTPAAHFQILKQKKSMNKADINYVLEHLKVPQSSHIIFAVQGGIFSEGVDYHGNMAIGAFIIGPPLPNFNLEREKMKEYYDQHYSAGFDYAYVYPAMAKAIQAAGRVIRSETDKGIIILMDNRFINLNYTKCMPKDWFEDNPNELVSKSILNDITQFWSEI